LGVVNELFKLFRPFLLLLIKLLGHFFVGWVFEIRSEKSKVIIFGLLVIAKHLVKLS